MMTGTYASRLRTVMLVVALCHSQTGCRSVPRGVAPDAVCLSRERGIHATGLAGTQPDGRIYEVGKVDVPLTAPIPLSPSLSPSPPLAVIEAPAISLEQADELYAGAWGYEQQGNVACVDGYFQAASVSWRHLAAALAHGLPGPDYATAWQRYHESLSRLILSGQKHGRLDPRQGLLVNTPSGAAVVPIVYRGFPWRPNDFNQLVLPKAGGSRRLHREIRQSGLGVSLVALRLRSTKEPFMAKAVPFAATAVLKPAPEPAGPLATPSPTADARGATPVATLELYDPVRVGATEVAGQPVNLARDLSAPFPIHDQLGQPAPYRGFFQPGASDGQYGLHMIEPYQPGKIPIVFVHGLLSDPRAWINLANEMRAVPWIIDSFQFWVFQYPTGEPFLRAAANLREQLSQVVATYDSSGSDHALREMVVVGHSMGGLVAKLLITESGSLLWDQIARRPLAQIRADDRDREDLRRVLFFSPQPSVTRVVFIGTPHRGSSWASRSVGRLASRLVSPAPERSAEQQELVRDNPGVFSPDVARRLPTSLDLLEPDSPLLLAILRLPVNRAVTLHSIIGTGRPILGSGPADGVVPVTSARHAGVASELFIDARHSQLHDHPDTLRELIRILAEHLDVVHSRPR